MFAVVIGCALIPRFALVAALGERAGMLGRPVALAPEPGGPQVVGEVSGAAEAFGIHDGMRLGEALGRCPSLALVAPDAERAAEAWEEALRRLEGIGAAVESDRPGEAFFELDGLRPLWGGAERVLRRARRALTTERPKVRAMGHTLGRSARRGAVGVPRLGAGPTRLCAYAAALRARPRRGPVIVPAGAARTFLAAQPIGLLRGRLYADPIGADAGAQGKSPSRRRGQGVLAGAEQPMGIGVASVPDTLERVGVRTLGELASLPDAAVADRFGEPGLRALRMARGSDGALRPRPRPERLAERLELPEGCSGTQLERALRLLIDRLLAHPGRRGRTVRRLRLGAQLAGGGGWGSEVVLREASADRDRLRLTLAPKLGELPGPATALSLRAVELGPPAHDQGGLERSPQERRRERIAEAVRQARAAGGRDAVLRVLEVEPASRVPERRAMLTPYE
jgi:protein ImuB